MSGFGFVYGFRLPFISTRLFYDLVLVNFNRPFTLFNTEVKTDKSTCWDCNYLKYIAFNTSVCWGGMALESFLSFPLLLFRTICRTSWSGIERMCEIFYPCLYLYKANIKDTIFFTRTNINTRFYTYTHAYKHTQTHMHTYITTACWFLSKARVTS